MLYLIIAQISVWALGIYIAFFPFTRRLYHSMASTALRQQLEAFILDKTTEAKLLPIVIFYESRNN